MRFRNKRSWKLQIPITLVIAIAIEVGFEVPVGFLDYNIKPLGSVMSN